MWCNSVIYNIQGKVNAHITELYNIRENNIKNVCFVSNNKLSATFFVVLFWCNSHNVYTRKGFSRRQSIRTTLLFLKGDSVVLPVNFCLFTCRRDVRITSRISKIVLAGKVTLVNPIPRILPVNVGIVQIRFYSSGGILNQRSIYYYYYYCMFCKIIRFTSTW